MNGYELYNDYNITFETPDDSYSYFFGYYDKSPLNKTNDKLLSHRVAFDGRDVQDGDIAEVGYFDLHTKEFIKINETLAWNWQQGSQLQWLPPKFDEEVIYNSIENNKFVSIIYNINTKAKRVIPFPIYVVHPNGKEALSVNYERHYWCRPGYNYQNIKNKKWNKPYHEEDRIYRVDLKSGKIEQIISIKNIVNNHKLPEFDSCDNWLEHLMYNTSGNRFMFFHRWHKDNIDQTRLFTANSDDGNDLFFYHDNRFYSHAHWKNENELTIWSLEPTEKSKNFNLLDVITKIKQNNVLKFTIKPIYLMIKPLLSKHTVHKISPQSKLINYIDKTDKYEIVGDGLLSGNGHSTWKSDRKVVLNDTYDDENGYRHLMLFDIEQNKIIKIGKFFSTYNSCGYRADLHPRFSIDGKSIVIDSAHTGKTKQLVIER
ncbi:conserved hypothetical protein [Candidatus Magnetomoraceae bacterium gMMP-1]